MRILLIQPPFELYRNEVKKCHLPLGLAYLAGSIRDRHQVAALDAIAEGYENELIINQNMFMYGLDFVNIKLRIKEFSPHIVGISCPFSSQVEVYRNLCRAIKEIDRKIIVVLGGAHPSALPEIAIQDENVDFVVLGEGEIILRNLLDCIEKGKEVSTVEGLAYRSNGEIRVNPRKEYIGDLDTISFPYWDIFPLERYFYINNPHGIRPLNLPFFPIITSRGCPYRCIFCASNIVWGRKFRARTVENVLAEIDYLKKNFGAKELLFEDDNLTLEKNRAKEIFNKLIENRYNISWSTPNGISVNDMDNELLVLMKKAGCYSISLGVESGDQSFLNNVIKKPLKLIDVETVIKQAKKIGLKVTLFFVIGLPMETKRQIEETFKFAKSVDVDFLNISFAIPLPGSELYNYCLEKKLISPENIFSRLRATFPVISTVELNRRQLEKMFFKEQLFIYLKSFLKHPLSLTKRLHFKIIQQPKYLMSLSKRMLTQIFK